MSVDFIHFKGKMIAGHGKSGKIIPITNKYIEAMDICDLVIPVYKIIGMTKQLNLNSAMICIRNHFDDAVYTYAISVQEYDSIKEQLFEIEKRKKEEVLVKNNMTAINALEL